LRELGRERSGVTWFEAPEGFHARPDGVWRGDELVVARGDVPLPGVHNLRNVAAALATADLLGVPAPAALPAIRSFEALPHRLQTVLGEPRGRAWVDDSISTTPQSAIAAMAVYEDRPLTVLLGGTDRGQEHDELVAALESRRPPTAAVLLADTGPRIAAALTTESVAVRDAADVGEAVALADALTPEGGVVLLSPAAASFPAFRSFEERGERFAAAARALVESRAQRGLR
ncbi:MAG TPA: hypothetical protein VHB30_13220, partial [Solirubrobacteraceae bacterium]|nr:hypothetical protein [Solirubrobacteraceae bacterium]